jgi:hypothetical protein
MQIRYVVEDARQYRAVPAGSATAFDIAFYRTLLERAGEEILAAYPSAAPGKKMPVRSGNVPGVKKPGTGNATLF